MSWAYCVEYSLSLYCINTSAVCLASEKDEKIGRNKELEQSLGKDIKEVLGLNQTVFDFEITPNRPDCLSIEGLGREVAVSLNEPFKNPRKNLDEMKVENKDDIEGLTVEITAPDLCYRYIARVVKNVKIAPSPD